MDALDVVLKRGVNMGEEAQWCVHYLNTRCTCGCRTMHGQLRPRGLVPWIRRLWRCRASVVLKALNKALDAEEHEDLLLFAFRALPGKCVDIRLDKVRARLEWITTVAQGDRRCVVDNVRPPKARLC